MEWRIGEIFEYNGEWLQCVEQPKKYDKTVCAICAFQGNGNCELDRCSGTYRSDKKSVIFKKLEKVGESYEYFVQHKGIVMLQPYKLLTAPFINGVVCNVNYDTNTIDLEIKQNKEDMEEKKLNLKPFDIQKAREGKPVCTRDGRKARIICFDVKGSMYPIIALIEESEGEKLCSYMPNGRSYKNEKECIDDLMMLTEKKEGWVNICRNLNTNKTELDTKDIYNTKEEAIQNLSSMTYVTTVKIEWEE